MADEEARRPWKSTRCRTPVVCTVEGSGWKSWRRLPAPIANQEEEEERGRRRLDVVSGLRSDFVSRRRKNEESLTHSPTACAPDCTLSQPSPSPATALSLSLTPDPRHSGSRRVTPNVHPITSSNVQQQQQHPDHRRPPVAPVQRPDSAAHISSQSSF